MTPTDARLLELAAARYAHEGARDRAALDLGLSPVRFWQRVNALIDTEAALAHDPLTVGRLRRLREARRAARVSGWRP